MATSQANYDTDVDVTVDFAKIREERLLPRGEYLLRNNSAELKVSRAGFPKISTRVEVLEGDRTGVTFFPDFSCSPKAIDRSMRAFVGMGLDPNFRGKLSEIAFELTDLEYYAIVDVQQSDGLNPTTGTPYDPRNVIVSTSTSPRTSKE